MNIQKTIEYFKSSIAAIHGMTINVGLIESVRVLHQNQQVPISQLGFCQKNNKYIDIQVYDVANLELILNALKAHSFNVYGARTIIRIAIPIASKETREKNKKMVTKLAEKAKVAIRQIRKDMRKLIKGLSEDDVDRAEKTIQNEVDESVKTIDKLVEFKFKEL